MVSFLICDTIKVEQHTDRKGKIMKTNVTKRIVTFVLAFAVVFTTVFAGGTSVEAAENVQTLYISSALENATAGSEIKVPFTATSNKELAITVLAPAATNMQISIYDSTGKLEAMNQNPVSVVTSDWMYVEKLQGYAFIYSLKGFSSGDYSCGIPFSSDTQYILEIDQLNENAKISNTKAIITKGFTKKLSVTGAKVKSWKSKNEKIAKVDKNGKVTGVKAGKTTVYAVTEDGQNLICQVEVKENKYTDKVIASSDLGYKEWGINVYKASFDKSGNLVMTARVAYNGSGRMACMKNVKITVKDENGKTVGVYKTSRKNVTVLGYSTKDVKFVIKKSALKKKKFDLRNSSIVEDATGHGYNN